MNLYNKLRRFIAKKLRKISAEIEPVIVHDQFSILKAHQSEISQSESTIVLTEHGNSITLRKASSDVMVFQQVFIDKEYSDLVDIVLLNKISIKTVLDLGANIGLTSIYLHKYFPKATYICVEPDEHNFTLMKTNLSNFSNIIAYQKAVWNTEEDIYLNRNFRDGEDWSISTSNDKVGAYAKVNAITIDVILNDNNLNIIDLLKIDIEGAEVELFKNNIHLNFLNKTKVIAIEIHNEFNVRDSIASQLKKHNFLLIDSKQTLLAINLNHIK